MASKEQTREQVRETLACSEHNCVATDRRLKFPSQAELADYGGSRKAAINFFCKTCMGDAGRCQSVGCILYPFCPIAETVMANNRRHGETDRHGKFYAPSPKQYKVLKLAKQLPDKD